MKYEHLWNINNSITNWHWWFSYLLLIFSSITKCKIIIELDHSESWCISCRLLECNMDVVIIYRGKFSVSRKIRMQVLCHTLAPFPAPGELDIMVWEDISTGNKKTDISCLFCHCHSWKWCLQQAMIIYFVTVDHENIFCQGSAGNWPWKLHCLVFTLIFMAVCWTIWNNNWSLRH